MNKKRFFACVAMFLVMILFWPARGTAAENIKKVALFPFEINSTTRRKHRRPPGNGLPGRRRGTSEIEKPSVLSKRTAIIAATAGKRLNDALALEVGRKTGAAYTVTGSVHRIR